MLTKSGVGKRNCTFKSVAETYARQISVMIKSTNDWSVPQKVFQNLCEGMSQDGAEATKYAYLATLQNFVLYIELEHPYFQTNNVQVLKKHITNWLQKQRKSKEKRKKFVKEQSRKKLKTLPFPFNAVQLYEKKYGDYIQNLQQTRLGMMKKQFVGTLYADIFLKIICKLGCRPSVLRGLRIKEMSDAEKTQLNNWSIPVD